MRRLAVIGLGAAALIVAALALPALADKDKPAPRADRRFDHAGHATAMKAGGKGTEGCAGRCHGVQTDGSWVHQGKKEHARCFGCHKFETSCSSLARGEGKVCLTCHVNLKARCVPSGGRPLTGRPPEFAALFSHKQHTRPNATSGQQCEGCHGEFGKSAPRRGKAVTIGHDNCSACHERGIEPFMSQCVGCHVDAKAAPAIAGPRQANPFAVTGAFDHQRHARADRVGTSGKDCLVCHGNIAQAASDAAMPMPTMQSCYQGCHDGKKAFSATGATCTRCHQGGRP